MKVKLMETDRLVVKAEYFGPVLELSKVPTIMALSMVLVSYSFKN